MPERECDCSPSFNEADDAEIWASDADVLVLDSPLSEGMPFPRKLMLISSWIGALFKFNGEPAPVDARLAMAL